MTHNTLATWRDISVIKLGLKPPTLAILATHNVRLVGLLVALGGPRSRIFCGDAMAVVDVAAALARLRKGLSRDEQADFDAVFRSKVEA